MDLCEQGLRIHKKIISKELEPFQKKMEEQLKQNLRKAMPYRKKDQQQSQRRKTFDNSSGMFDVQSSALNTSPRVTRNSKPLANRERNTMSPQTLSNIQKSRPDSGSNRHTFVFQPNSPSNYSDSEAPPPLPQKSVASKQASLPPRHSGNVSFNRSSQSSQESLSGEVPPMVPLKAKPLISRNVPVPHTSGSTSENVENDDSADEPPPLLPKKRSKMKKRDQILHRSDVDSDSSLNDSTDSITIARCSSFDGNFPPRSCTPQDRVVSYHSDDSGQVMNSLNSSPLIAKQHSKPSSRSSSVANEEETNTTPALRLALTNEHLRDTMGGNDNICAQPPGSPLRTSMHPSHESAPSNTSPFMSPTMPMFANSPSSPPGLSPIMPRKTPPAVPPPFVSPHQSPTSLILPFTSNTSQVNGATPSTRSGSSSEVAGSAAGSSPVTPPTLPPREKNL